MEFEKDASIDVKRKESMEMHIPTDQSEPERRQTLSIKTAQRDVVAEKLTTKQLAEILSASLPP